MMRMMASSVKVRGKQPLARLLEGDDAAEAVMEEDEEARLRVVEKGEERRQSSQQMARVGRPRSALRWKHGHGAGAGGGGSRGGARSAGGGGGGTGEGPPALYEY